MSIYVEGFDGLALGDAVSFGEAKRMQLASVPEELRRYYGGIGTNGQCLFYEMPDELVAKYPNLGPRT
jgi:hypothetical protein